MLVVCVLALGAPTLAFAPAPRTSAARPPTRHAAARLALPVPRQPQRQPEREALHHGGVAPLHAHAASYLSYLLVALFARFGRRDVQHAARLESSGAEADPCLIDGALCEEYATLHKGHTFWVCYDDVSHAGFACRKARATPWPGGMGARVAQNAHCVARDAGGARRAMGLLRDASKLGAPAPQPQSHPPLRRAEGARDGGCWRASCTLCTDLVRYSSGSACERRLVEPNFWSTVMRRHVTYNSAGLP